MSEIKHKHKSEHAIFNRLRHGINSWFSLTRKERVALIMIIIIFAIGSLARSRI